MARVLAPHSTANKRAMIREVASGTELVELYALRLVKEGLACRVGKGASEPAIRLLSVTPKIGARTLGGDVRAVL
jgi:hypothetical protein